MIPLFPKDAFFSLNPSVFCQVYNNMVNYNAMSSMILASQEQALKSQLLSMMQMRAQLLQTPFKPQVNPMKLEVKAEDSLSGESNCESPFKGHSTHKNSVETVATPPQQLKPQKSSETSHKVANFGLVKMQLEEMIYYLLNNIGKIDQAEIERTRRKYAHNLYLIPIFDILVSKYFPVKKHREDIIRYVIRKALKSFKNDTIQKDKVYGKRAYAVLCKKYFNINTDEVEKTGLNMEDEKELIEFLLPYRKNSKNRTMNTNFTTEIFSSPEFCEDYKKFLNNFDSLLIEDNNKKIEKLIKLAEECILNNCPEKIKKCTRLPWLQAWIEKTREIAFNLVNPDLNEEEDTGEVKNKKIKIDCVAQPAAIVKLEGNQH